MTESDRISGIPLPGKGVTGPGTLALAPFRQIRERGLECHDDATPLQVLEVERAHRIDTDELLATLPDAPATLSGAGSDLDDDAYAAVVVLGIFLGCQLLSSRLGLTVSRGEQPQQRTQRTTDALGSPATVGFYNSFSVRAGGGPAEALHRAGAKLCRRPGTDEVIAPRGPDVAGVQFRPESVLSRSGAELFLGPMRDASRQGAV
ncbi:hypothetical protein [Streptomyces sp. NPDC015680]|uniref:glutamine amidotransferase-related protein n=1 Tax=Streptomyces sp. NPDC015680 TaxID=3364962 RepID=UPI0036FCF9F1